MHVRTKIICTIGPSVATYEKMRALAEAGMDVARLNFSHGDHEQHKKMIDLIKKVREDIKKPIAVMLDSKGPEIRIRTKEHQPLDLRSGHQVLLCSDNKFEELNSIEVIPHFVIKDMKVGMRVLFDDGYIEGRVTETVDGKVRVEIDNPGILKSYKKINIPHSDIYLPAMSEDDIADFTFGCKEDVDIIAASFIQSAENVLDIRRLLKSLGKSEILIVSKIESVSGVKNFDGILQVSDGIMVARGDLGVELPLKEVPQLQKMMIRKCNLEGKFVVTATQMLESMISNPRPTRAEVSDVANAIYDSTSCVMLSGETAAGKYPIECCKMMRSVVEQAEKDFDYEGYDKLHHERNYKDTSSAIALATVKTAAKSSAQAIFTYTSSGFTARILSKFRPRIPIISVTHSKKIFNQLGIIWGVVPVFGEYDNAEEAFDLATCFGLKHKYVHYGDRVFVTAGSPFGMRGTTNMMMIKNIGDVASRGLSSEGKQVYAKASIILLEEDKKDLKDKIAVMTHCEEGYELFLKECKGIILQNYEEDQESELAIKKLAKTYDIPYILRAENAINLIKEGEWITLSPAKGVVFRGEVVSDQAILEAVCHKKEGGFCS